MKIAIGSDHAGFKLKNAIRDWLVEHKHEINDFGAYTEASVDYPEVAHPLSKAVSNGEYQFGILVCGSGNGVCMTANKHQSIRAGLAWNSEVAELIRLHNDANVICIPARFLSIEEGTKIVETFLSTEFEGGRHGVRVSKISC